LDGSYFEGGDIVMAMDGSAYIDENGNGIFKKSYCAYFDILGFSEKIKASDLDFFNHYLNVIKKELENVEFFKKLSGDENEFEIKIFTDNFVIGFPWVDEEGELELGTLFIVLSILQYNLLTENIFIRGGISLSELYMDENTVFGPALIEAYQLEEKSAIYPRIILSDKLRGLILKHISFYLEGWSMQEDQFIVDSDGVLFINYLHHLIEIWNQDQFGDKAKYLTEKLLLHKKKIEENLVSNRSNIRVFNKFSWVAKYHNHFCNKYLEEIEGLDIGSLLISDDIRVIGITKLTEYIK
jgi:hypothetical protein